MTYNQQEFDVKLEWGIRGIKELAPVSDVVIIVDVLSFSTCVDIAVSNGAVVYPYRWKDETAAAYARSLGAELASFSRRDTDGYSLSPASLTGIQSQTKLVLPSPNGSALSLATKTAPTLCGGLRNAKAVAEFAVSIGRRVSVIPAGERWANDALRPAFEDLLGAGAIVSHLTGSLSPESKAAWSVYRCLKETLFEEIKNCGSGRELIERGFEKDVYLASALNVSNTVPLLTENRYVGRKKSTADKSTLPCNADHTQPRQRF